jgi:hypothetical protein
MSEHTRPAQQTPDWQVVPPGQTMPQPPQLPSDMLVSTHVFEQLVWFDPQHLPAEQTCPGAQALMQPPQFMVLLCVSTHAPMHTVPEQQALMAHDWPGAQGVLQAPQCSASLVVSTQRPAQAVRLPPQPAPHAPA